MLLDSERFVLDPALVFTAEELNEWKRRARCPARSGSTQA
jgi:hypothetical protein